MTRIVVKKIIWDDFSLEHIKKHGVSVEVVNEAGKQILYHIRTYNNRFLAIGKSGTRLITIILKKYGQGEYYIVSARDASKKERAKIYEKQKKQDSKI